MRLHRGSSRPASIRSQAVGDGAPGGTESGDAEAPTKKARAALATRARMPPCPTSSSSCTTIPSARQRLDGLPRAPRHDRKAARRQRDRWRDLAGQGRYRRTDHGPYRWLHPRQSRKPRRRRGTAGRQPGVRERRHRGDPGAATDRPIVRASMGWPPARAAARGSHPQIRLQPALKPRRHSLPRPAGPCPGSRR